MSSEHPNKDREHKQKHRCECQDDSKVWLRHVSRLTNFWSCWLYHYGCGRCGNYWQESEYVET